MDVTNYLKNNIVILDGGMGTLLQERGLKPGEHPERWNISHSDDIVSIHKAYYEAGSNIVNTNTFGANSLKFEDSELEEIIGAAILNAKKAREESGGSQPKYVALDIGPCGKLLKPYGDLDFEKAVEIFAKIVRLGVKYRADLITIETMNDSYETKAALLAAKENSDLPIIVTNAFGADGKLMTGANAEAMTALLEGMRADAIGVNCSLGPKELLPIIESYLKYASVPVIFKPNAGLPKIEGGKAKYDVSADEFAGYIKTAVEKGVRIVGGCCGTTPEYIKAVADAISGLTPLTVSDKGRTVVSSYTHAVTFGRRPVIIGERINPTGKKRFKQALIEGDISYILGEGIGQQEKGADVLDVNVGLPDINEPELLLKVTEELQAVINLPLQLDTADAEAMERALRHVNGKALINSVSGKEDSMRAIFPLAKKYGGVVIALTLDEKGIPETAEGRLSVARNILKTAAEYGIASKDIIFDPLTLTISANGESALVTLKAIELIEKELGCCTSLGISNISFGLPSRDAINTSFFNAALERGLSAGIVNPYSTEIMKTYHAFLALHNMDTACENYIKFMEAHKTEAPAEVKTVIAKSENGCVPKDEVCPQNENDGSDLKDAIIKGLKADAHKFTEVLLRTKAPLDIISGEIIPALDVVGKGYESGRTYLPQLLMSAEAAKAAFELIKSKLAASKETGKDSDEKGLTCVIATVEGDIHDIGKNIVKLLLENYGFKVIDLGKDVPAETVLKAVELHKAELVGLSALMTTTVPAMEETIRLLHEKASWAKIVVGGAVLNQTYADSIKADKYAKDAMETVRYAESMQPK